MQVEKAGLITSSRLAGDRPLNLDELEASLPVNIALLSHVKVQLPYPGLSAFLGQMF